MEELEELIVQVVFDLQPVRTRKIVTWQKSIENHLLSSNSEQLMSKKMWNKEIKYVKFIIILSLNFETQIHTAFKTHF